MLRSQELFFIVPIPGDTVPVPDDILFTKNLAMCKKLCIFAQSNKERPSYPSTRD